MFGCDALNEAVADAAMVMIPFGIEKQRPKNDRCGLVDRCELCEREAVLNRTPALVVCTCCDDIIVFLKRLFAGLSTFCSHFSPFVVTVGRAFRLLW